MITIHLRHTKMKLSTHKCVATLWLRTTDLPYNINTVFAHCSNIKLDKLLACVTQALNNIQRNSVITNRFLGEIGHFTTQINPVITNPGYNEEKFLVSSCCL